MSTEVRVRFAPSPTGYLHIGGVRTALYNYLFAKKNQGKFILRIEDTDTCRSKHEYTQAIQEGLRWLGFKWDEGPYFQSERLDVYRDKLEFLKERGLAYRCFCSPRRLQREREEAKKAGKDVVYSGRCRNLSDEKLKKFAAEGRKFAWRFKTPAKGKIVFKDIIKGVIEFDCSTIGDFVIMRGGGVPTYNFTCTVDDADLRISHVIRGDDHISNTPKQILIYRALEEKIPNFAHLPQVHGSDGKRLSKRTGAVSLSHYIDSGYLSEALVNYLALLGWSTQDSQQIFGKKELIDKFSLERVSSSPGIFDTDKLDWINGKYLRSLSAEEITRRAEPWLRKENLIKNKNHIPEKVVKTVEMEKDKIGLLSDVPGRIDFMVKDTIIYDEKAVKKRLKKPGVKKILTEAIEVLKNTEPFTAEKLEEKIRDFVQKKDISAGKLFHPLRVAVSGKMKGPGVFKLLEFIGREKTLERIEYAAKEISENE